MPDTPPTQRFANFLKFWRGTFHVSQEALAEMVGTSVRHVSRLENGISRPSEAMTEQIADALKLGQRDRSHLRIAAGYAPIETGADFNSPELKWLRAAMLKTLQVLDPYPTALIDSAGNILMVNKAWVGFYRDKVDSQRLQSTNNLYDFLFDGNSTGELSEEWKDALSLIIMAFKQNTMLNESARDEKTLTRILTYPGVPADWQQRASHIEPRASFKIRIRHNGRDTSFYSVSQSAGALGPAAYLTEPRITITTLYPEDTTLNMDELVSGHETHPLLFY